ncbi:MAG: hypothetical protein JKY52_19605, partial [Flavobacteriales bacterium]|nr:hypothetical protein [Flavobacteriales bacterium]
MVRLIPFVIILQVVCLYHAYTNHAAQKWYWFILFFPFLGSLFYLYHHFYSRQNIDNLAEGLKSTVSTNYHIEKLEKQVKFADTVTHKSSLADAYAELGRHREAVELYLSCLEGFNEDDPDILLKLVEVNYRMKEFEKAVSYGDLLAHDLTFSKSEVKASYAWALFETKKRDLAEKAFEEMDIQFTNYPQRLKYCQFLHRTGQAKDA